MTAIDLVNANDLTNCFGGRYALGAIVGQGGMSTVYEAVDLNTSSAVAVKLFHAGVELSDSLPRRRREVQLASGLHHPGIVELLDADVEESEWGGGRAYIVTELVNGPTLSQRLRDQPLSEGQVISMGAALCDALAYMHEQGIVHRDLKPANILLSSATPDGPLHPKLADFGLAYEVDSTRMTGVGLTAGTPNYLSPEQVRGTATTPASDIYALGLVLIEALNGRPAFPGHGLEAALARLSRDPLPPLNIDPQLAQLLTMMTASTPSDRPTASVVAAQLRALSRGSLLSELSAFARAPGAPTPTPTLRAPRSDGRRRGVALAAGLALLCASVVGLVIAVLAGFVGASHRTQLPPADAAIASVPSRAGSGSTTSPPSSSVDSARGTDAVTATVPPAASIGPAAAAAPTKPATGPGTPGRTAAAQIARTAGQVDDKSHGKKNGNNKP